MVINHRNVLSIPSMNRVNTRSMQDCGATGFGAEVAPAGSPSPRPVLWPELARPASSPGNLAKGYPVHSKRTRKPEAEATRLESEVHPCRLDRDYPSPDQRAESTDLAMTLTGSSQLCAPATTAQK